MNSEEQAQLAHWVERQLNGTLSQKEHAKLEEFLLDSAEARSLYLDLTHQHAALEDLGESLIQEELHQHRRPRPSVLRHLLPAAAAAAVTWVCVWWWTKPDAAPVVATLIASDHASWESPLPTTLNTPLTAGFMKLLSGVATIRFESGVEVILEAPAHLVLEDPMKGRLLAGSAVIDVPEEAIGFVMETPDSYAVDHGTVFSVSVEEDDGAARFEVLSGEISVHHPLTSEVHHLTDAESISATRAGLSDIGEAAEEGGQLPVIDQSLRLMTRGREASIIRGDNLESYLHPDFLMVKHGTFVEKFDRRALFAFDLPDVVVEDAALRLNLVPCGLGFASRLPEISTFVVYGFSVEDRHWSSPLKWEEAPSPGLGTRLLEFEISRGVRERHFVLSSPELLQFLSDHQGSDVSFLIVRETDEAEGNGLVHAFASSIHPSASGPILELISSPQL